MTAFQAFKEDFKLYESKISYNNKGEVIKKLLSPYQIRTLDRQIRILNKKLKHVSI